jgi:hypothetical protein
VHQFDAEAGAFAPILKKTLPQKYSMRVFNLAKNTLVWRGFMEISQDYPL